MLSKINTSGSTLRLTNSRNKSSKGSSSERFKQSTTGSRERVTPEEKDRLSRFITGVPFLASIRGLTRRTKSDPSVTTTASVADPMASPAARPSLEGNRRPETQRSTEGAKPAEDEGRPPKWYERSMKKGKPGSSPDPTPAKPTLSSETAHAEKANDDDASSPDEVGQRLMKEINRLLGMSRALGHQP